MAMQRLVGRRRRRGGGRFSGALAGVAAGAGLAYFLDPRRGAARRSQAMQRAGRIAREMEETVEAGARDLSQRARGIAHEARTRIEPDRASDDVVAERVRARLGRLTSHAHAIRVASRGGHVELTGPVLRAERARVVRGVRMVRGVHGVEDRLDPHETAAGVASLQGTPAALIPAPSLRWTPGMRLLAGAAGVLLALRALFGRGLARIPSALAGMALIARVLSEYEPAEREAHRIAARAAGKRATRARERRLEAEAHEGAWHPEAETRGSATPAVEEVKSPAELEPGIAHASPEPTFSDRVARPGYRRAPPPQGGRSGEGGEDERPAIPTTDDVEGAEGYSAGSPGGDLRESDLGMVAPREEPGEGTGEEPRGGGAKPKPGGAGKRS